MAQKAGDASLLLNDAAAATGHYATALEVARRNAGAAGASLDDRRNLALTLWRVGNAAKQSGEIDAARAAYGEALALVEQLAAENPQDPRFPRDAEIIGTSLANVADGKPVTD